MAPASSCFLPIFWKTSVELGDALNIGSGGRTEKKRKEERVKRKEERGKRKEQRGKGKDRSRRKKERGKSQEQRAGIPDKSGSTLRYDRQG
ncbi:MAG: hypothetical protein OET07_16005 [Desulfobacteraceae bacterium]|nr:hypothetical protein [Desulfobacteraceae bacterium]